MARETIDGGASVAYALEVMPRTGQAMLIVTDDGHPVGIAQRPGAPSIFAIGTCHRMAVPPPSRGVMRASPPND
jgi:hypothetical protein